MADEGQVENLCGAEAGNIRRVPRNLLGFLTSRIAEYVDRTEGITAEIHEYPGQPAKLVLYGAKDLFEPTQQPEDIIKNVEDVHLTNKVLVKNFPSNVDEDMLEIFFESKKSGGGPVKNVQLNREKKWAVVEFCEAGAVEGVMNRVPITMMSKELDIRPYTPLIQGEGQLENIEVRNLPKELTDDLIAMHIEGGLEENEVSSAEYKSDDCEAEDIEDETRSLEQLGNTDRWKTIKGTVKESITCLQPVQLRMLQIINYPNTILEQLPEIKVKINLERNEISFEGNAKTVHSASLNLLETLSHFGLNRIDDKPKEHVELYKRKRVMAYINNKLEAQNILCAWKVEKDMIVICSLKENLCACTKIINECVNEIKFPVCRESSGTLITQEWENEMKQIQAKIEVFIKVLAYKTSTHVSVIGLDKEVPGIVDRIKTFLESQLDIDSVTIYGPENVSVKFNQLYCLNSTLAHNLMDQVAERLSEAYHVTIKNAYGVDRNYVSYHRFTITGTNDGREHAKRRIAELDIKF